MPITPFHFGPGAILHAAAPRHVSFLAFCATNVLIDIESLYNLVHRRTPVHAFFHSYVGATLVIIATVALFAGALRLARLAWIPNVFRWKELTLWQVAAGAALGGYSHVLLDSVMHPDIRPFAPFASANPLFGILSLDALHWLCVVAGIVGTLIVWLHMDTATDTSRAPSSKD